MNLPLRAETDRQAVLQGLRSGRPRPRRHRPRPHARGSDIRSSRADGGHGARDRVRGGPARHHPGTIGLELLIERPDRRRRALRRLRALAHPGSAANVRLVDLDAEWEAGEAGWERPTARSLDGRPGGRADDDCRRRRGLPRALLCAGGGPVICRLLDREHAALVVVDVQEAFRPAVLDFERVAGNTGAVPAEGARILGLPVVATEQYLKGLGRTVPEVVSNWTASSRSRRSRFLRHRRRRFRPRRPRPGAAVRIEAHVCVADRPRAARPRPRGARGPRRRHLPQRGEPGAGAAQDGDLRARSSRASRPRCSSCSAQRVDEFKKVQALVK